MRSLFGHILLGLALLTLPLAAEAQSTRVRGRVTDKDSGEGVPFVAVFFKGTTIGVSTDLDGYYTLETRDAGAKVLVASLLGYVDEEKEVRQAGFNTVNFELKPSSISLNAATVKPDNRYMKWILSQIDKHRSRNNPEKHSEYQCDVYSKMELDVTNPEENLMNKAFRKNFGFVLDYVDTSLVSGMPYLPVMISETVSRKYHRMEPAIDKEVIEASKISGMKENNVLSQFTGSLHLKMNFYNNFINSFEVQIPSPIAENGQLYYNYFLIDSLQVEGRKTYKIRFHPRKNISSPAFDGEMAIDAEEWALREVHAKLLKGENVNWIRDLSVDVVNQRIGDSAWFYLHDQLYVDFSLTMRDSSKLLSFIGKRQLEYIDPVFFETPSAREIAEQGYNVMVMKEAGSRSDEYWAEKRPYELSEQEHNIYVMVDSIQNVKLYRDIYTIIATISTGYLDHGKLGIGPVSQFYSFNKVEGSRFKLGLRTTKDFSSRMRFTVFGAYGIKDNKFKYGGNAEFMISSLPTRKITIVAKRDYEQLGKVEGILNSDNIFTSLFAKDGGGNRRSFVNRYSISYEHEFNENLSQTYMFAFRRVFSNRYVPMDRADGSSMNSVGTNLVHVTTRFSWEQSATRGTFEKYYITSNHPVITLDLEGSVEGVGHNDYSYFRPEITFDYRWRLPPVGTSTIRLNSGIIVGKVPYPLLKLHEGNDTYFLDTHSFSCMDYYEFASDTWVTLFWEHNFQGFFLGKIPGIRRLQLREVLTVKAAYGTLSEKNNGIRGTDQSVNAEMLFPEETQSLDKPYIEVGAGISNIFRIFRIDAFWRLTHRYSEIEGVRTKSDNCFALSLGMEFKF